MSSHLLIESRGPMAGPGCASFLTDAATLARTGGRVELLLIQDGVVAAANPQPELTALVQAGGRLLIDAFSAAQRALGAADLGVPGRLVDMEEIAGRVLDPTTRVVWH